MALDVFDYQITGANFLASRERAGLFDEMRVGKSAQAVRAADLLALKRGIVICPAIAREVWRGEFAKFGIIPRSIIKGVNIHDYVAWMRGRFDVLVTSFEQATRWADKIHQQGEVLDFCIVDECFPYDTPVLTEIGPVAIGRLVAERLDVRVYSLDNDRLVLRPINRYVTTSSVALVKVDHSHGSFVCTPNHKIRTNRGFVIAAELGRDDYLYLVQETAHESTEVSVLQHEVFGAVSMAHEIESRIADSVSAHARRAPRYSPTGRSTPYAPTKCRSGISRQSGRRVESAERHVIYRTAGRQRLYDGAATLALEDVTLGGVSHGVGDRDGRRVGAIRIAAARVQSGFSPSSVYDGNRSGRPVPCRQEGAVLGLSKDGSVTRARVVRVTPVEQGSDSRPESRGTEGTPTYNLEVEETHNYFAAGVNVGNCHYLKNSEAARTKAILGDYTMPVNKSAMGIIDWARHAWMLSGTPMANDPIDIYTFLRFVRCMPLTQGVFQKRYFTTFQKTFGARNTPRADKAAELRRLIENNSMRRTQKQAGLSFPPIHLTGVTLDGDTTEIMELLKQYPGLDYEIVKALEAGGLKFLDAQHIATLRRLVAEAKAVPYASLLYEELQNTDQKYVVMGISKYALQMVQNYLTERGITAVLINGDVPEKKRGPMIEAFQNEPRVRVLLFNLHAGGTATSYTAGNNLDIMEGDWAPGPNAQGIMRVQGMSQRLNIRARFITLSNSIDEAVNRIVVGKTAAILDVMGQQLLAHAPIDEQAHAA